MNHTDRMVVRKPAPREYGLPDGFRFNEYDIEAEKFTSFKKYIQAAIKFAIYVCCVSALSFLPTLIIDSPFYAFIWIAIPFAIPLSIWMYETLHIEGLIKPRPKGYLTYWDEVSAYRADLAAWEFTNAESGLGYWQALRGTAFEKALALLFRRRGCNVTTTKGSGDGGIDLILKIGEKTFWCQCKGHAKPVSVAPIREIAGVCSTSQVTPVFLAVNGYTKSAKEAASSLGVKCLDAHDLCRIARLETVTSIE